MIILRNIKLRPGEEKNLRAKIENLIEEKDFSFEIYKRSLDARKEIFYVYQVLVDCKVKDKIYKKLKNNIGDYREEKLIIENKNNVRSALVVGAGPSGLFCAYTLLKAGVKVKIIERGDDIDSRLKKINNFLYTGELDTESNISFGEGGAGTFSDGKLTSRSKDPRSRKIFEILHNHGGPEDILYDSMPHIGTDILRGVIKNIRKSIIDMGGEIYFRRKLIDLKIKGGRILSVMTNEGEMKSDEYILALGNSARDTFDLLNKYVSLESKPFAVGFRIEHLREDINFAQYKREDKNLPPATYALTYSKKENPHNAYTFCMCPGGLVIPSSSEKDLLAVNGMSYHRRSGLNSNSALVASIDKKIFGEGPLAAMNYQRKIEKKAFILGGGSFAAPVQRLEDFLEDRPSQGPGKIIPSYKPAYKFTNLNNLYEPSITKVLKEAIDSMDKKLKGFGDKDAILTGAETRTSSPIRILRESYHTLEFKNLRPIGEGSGYAGGIISSALDGLKCAIEILEGTC